MPVLWSPYPCNMNWLIDDIRHFFFSIFHNYPFLIPWLRFLSSELNHFKNRTGRNGVPLSNVFCLSFLLYVTSSPSSNTVLTRLILVHNSLVALHRRPSPAVLRPFFGWKYPVSHRLSPWSLISHLRFRSVPSPPPYPFESRETFGYQWLLWHPSNTCLSAILGGRGS